MQNYLGKYEPNFKKIRKMFTEVLRNKDLASISVDQGDQG
jgi:hypothetical protein